MSNELNRLKDEAKDLVLVPLHTYMLVDKNTPNLDSIINKLGENFAEIFYDTLVANNPELTTLSAEEIEVMGSFLLGYVAEVEFALKGDDESIIEITLAFDPARLDIDTK